jgi:hypothetical protein
MTLRLSALFENKLDELSVNFYRHRSGSGRRTRQRCRRAAEDEPGTSDVSSPARRTTPRARPEMVPRVSARASTSRRLDDEEEPSSNGSDGLRMKISLTKGSVLSTTGLEDTERGNDSSIGTSNTLQTNHLDESTSQRTRTRSATRTSFRESLSSASSLVSETPDTTTQNGPSRYSTRSRVPPTRLKLNGVNADHESEDDDDGEDEVSEETEDESSEESDSSQRGKNVRSSRSGKTPTNRRNSSKKSSNSRGKQVVNSNRPVRTRASSRFDDSASESDGDSPEQTLDVSSRGRVRKKAFKMMDYVN